MRDSVKKFFDSRTLHIVLVSVSSVLLIVIALGAGVWFNRGRIFAYFINDYSRIVAGEKAQATVTTNGIESVAKQVVLPEVLSHEGGIEAAVQKANGAVVAIAVSKNVPKYTISFQQLNPFGNVFLNVPTQKADGYEKKEIGSGSGFIVSSDGLIVTNRHVVEDKDADYTVSLTTGKKYTATVLARDAILDVALIKITEVNLPHLTLGDSDTLKLGQTVIAIGNALGQFQNTVSVGVVSGLSRSITAGIGGGASEALDHVIQTDAAINPGNSGGPLLDTNGNVMGIDTAIAQDSQSIGFALPINSVKTVIDSVRATGKIIRPYMGIRFQVITPAYAAANHLDVDYGVLVKSTKADGTTPSVMPGSPADKAGIVEGDYILEINGIKIDEDHDLTQIIRAKRVGEFIKLKVLSQGTEKTLTIMLAAAPQE